MKAAAETTGKLYLVILYHRRGTFVKAYLLEIVYFQKENSNNYGDFRKIKHLHNNQKNGRVGGGDIVEGGCGRGSDFTRPVGDWYEIMKNIPYYVIKSFFIT